jgi:hypothetical protein
VSRRPTRRRRLAWALLAAAGAGAILLALPEPARGQAVTGRITGRVTDEATRRPVGGVTVIVQGQQGEDAALTDDAGIYTFATLPVGTYVVRFYAANVTTKVERPEVVVTAGATVRADVAIPSEAVAVEETFVVRKRAPPVDVGSTRTGMTVDEDYLTNVPLERTFGDVTEKAPGAFLESSGGVSIAGASALENVYILDGLNVTGLDTGEIMNRRPDSQGGSNLTLDFLKELQVNTGGYRAEHGGAMGGVINVITKSGSNQYHGSVFSYWSPYWMTAEPRRVQRTNVALVGTEKPDYDTNVGFEVGGPIIRNKLFFWAGFAPRFEKSHFFRDTLAMSEGQDGTPAVDPETGEVQTTLVHRVRTNQLRRSFQMGGKIDYLPRPDHRLTFGIFSTPMSSRHVRALNGGEAVNDPRWALQGLGKTNTDITLGSVSHLFNKRWRVETNLGLHRESFSDQSPYSDLNRINQFEWYGASLHALEGIPGCAPTASGFDPCPVDVYHNGGYGLVRNYTGNRWMAEVKSTNVLGKHELKYGMRFELVTFDQTRYYTGPPGGRGLIQHFPASPFSPEVNSTWTFFSLPRGTYYSQFQDFDPLTGNPDPRMDGQPLDLANAPYYRDQLVAEVKSINSAYFLQDTFHVLPNLVADAGVRLENQRMYDYRGDRFINLVNPGPRLGLVYDPTNDGRSKIYAHYGWFYETIPMNLAARYFGGEGILVRGYDSSMCNPPVGTWTGKGGEWNGCGAPIFNFFPNNGAPYPVQANLKGQRHSEIVGGFRYALTENLAIGIDYTRRWLDAVIEDGTSFPTFSPYVLGNPGNVPDSALTAVQNDIDAKEREFNAETDPVAKGVLEAQLADLKLKQTNLRSMATLPKPERTYNAVTVSANKRLARNWMLSGQYTYSRVIGNYNGLYDGDVSYFAPNGGIQYDTADLVLNRRGPLHNDRPHSGRVDGFYQLPVGRGMFIAGLSFSAFSGIPRNYIVGIVDGVPGVLLLPRGAAGRTPAVTQTDLKVSYRREITKMYAVEAFLDFFNIFNQRTALLTDDVYSVQAAAPIVNGTPADLPYAKNGAGAPLAKNANFGNGIRFQLPFHARMGLRFLF